MESGARSFSPERFLIDYQAGEIIFSQGDPGADMFIIHAGQVEIVQQAAGGEPEHLARLEKGDFFGEMSLLEELPRLASARALTPVKLIRIDSGAFDKLLRKDPEIAIRIMRKLSRRLRQTDEQLRNLSETAPAVAAIPAPGAAHSLVHLASRARFALSGAGETMVGRGDPVTGQQPDIDLTPVDPDRSSSRRHAKLYFRDGAVHVVEEIGTTNGTFVNGVRLEAGQPLRVAPGDELRFGLVELVLADDSRRQ